MTGYIVVMTFLIFARQQQRGMQNAATRNTFRKLAHLVIVADMEWVVWKLRDAIQRYANDLVFRWSLYSLRRVEKGRDAQRHFGGGTVILCCDMYSSLQKENSRWLSIRLLIPSNQLLSIC